MSQFQVLDWHLNAAIPDAYDHLGRIPLLIDPTCADPVWQQVQDNYPGGWQCVLGDQRTKWHLMGDDYLRYDGVAPIAPVAMAWLRDEKILVYPGGLVVVVEGLDFTVARIEP